MPASFDDLLNQILSSNPNLGRDQLITMVEQKTLPSRPLDLQTSGSPPFTRG